MFLPNSLNLPWQPENLTIQAKSGYILNADQVEYLKQIIKSINQMYSSIANAHNIWAYWNNGTATVSSGDTSVDVAHGLSKIPGLKDIQINPTNIPTNNVRWAITSVNATIFTITLSGNPGISGASFVWNVHILG